MRRRMTRLLGVCAVAMALALSADHAGAIEAKLDGGVLALTGGEVEVRLTVAEGTVAVRCGDRAARGKGVALKLSPDTEGKVAVTDLAKAEQPLSVGDADLVVARVPFHRSLPLTGVALWDAGGGATTLGVPLGAIGFPEEAVLAGYDLGTDEFFGPIIGSLARRVEGGQCKLIALGQATARPTLLCTSRSLLGAGDDLTKLSWDAQAGELSGTSRVAKGERYELRMLAPPEPQRWVAESATVSDADEKAGVRTLVMQTYQWLRIYITSPEARAVSWRVTFGRKPPRPIDAGAIRFSAKAASPRRVTLSCYGIAGEVVVRRNDGVEFVTGSGTLEDTSASPSTTYTYSVHPLSWTGRKPAVASAKVETPALPPLPPLPNVYLSDLDPVKAVNGWNGDPRRDKSIEDNPLRIRGEVYKRGMGVHAVAELVYAVRPSYRRFVAVVGVDDEKNDAPAGSVTFEVHADDKPLVKTGVLTPFDERVSINVAIPKGTKQIRLVVGDGGNGVGCDHADWANAGFVTEGEAEPRTP